MEEKTMYYANFNITFGQKEEPMLAHFSDVIYPAFISKIVRGNKDAGKPEYSFNNISVKEIQDDNLVLVGNIIKDTEYQVYTTKQQDGSLKDNPLHVPTAPYSRFIIFLNNHRMILIKNEPKSPDIRSFQKTVDRILSIYRNRMNREQNLKKDDKLPYAIVNIVDMKLKDDITKVLNNISAIKKFNIRFFPLNGDIDMVPIIASIRSRMKNLQSETANLNFNTPKSKQGVAELVEETSTSGLAAFKINGKDLNGQPINIKEDTFTSNQKIAYSGNISAVDDKNFISIAKKNPIISKVGDNNKKIFDRYKDRIKKLM